MKGSTRSALPLVIVLVALGFAAGVRPAAAEAPAPGRLFLPLALQRFSPNLRLAASADAYIFQSDPEANRGANPFLMAGYDGDEATKEGALRTLIKFNVPAGITAHVVQATLRVYYAGYSDFENHARTVTAAASLGAWSELTVTWANQPPPGQESGSTTITANDEWGYREIDVTSLVQAWLDGTIPDYGLYLTGPEKSGSDYSFRMFQSRETAHPPELVVRFQ